MLMSSAGPEVRPATLASLLRGRAGERPGRVAFTFLADGEAEGERLTYGELDRRARTIAAALRESLAPGDRALLLYPPGLEFIAAFFGCLYAGVIAVPAYPPRLNDRSQGRLRAVARDAEPLAALTTASILTAAAALPIPELAAVRWIATDALEASAIELPEPDPESIAFLQYTSGSTSTPKGVMVTHANLLHNERMIGEAFRQDEDSVVVGWLPLYHDMGLIGNVLQPLWAGGTCVLMSPVAFLQKPSRWLEAIHRYRGTTSGGPNFAYELCVRRIAEEQRAGLDLSSWRVAYNGAEPVRAETLERFAAAFAPQGFRPEAFYPCYGLAEATLFVSGGEAGTVPPVARLDAAALEAHEARPARPEGPENTEEARRLVSCGHAWAGQRIVVADPEADSRPASELPTGRIGEIWIAGPSVARGYWRNPEATERDFAARLESGEGPFLRTGDLGFLRDGELYVTGRLKDLIIIRGRNHYPQDLELTAERSHPDLRPGSGAAFSIEAAGEERLVLVQEVERRRRDGFEEVAEAVRGAVAREHEVQVHDVVLVRVGTVPKTSSGKIQRSACRALYLAGELAVVGRSVVVSATADASVAAVVPSRGSLLALEPEERRTVLERFLRERAAAAVGVPASAIDPDRPLTGLGLDSLAAIELKSGVETVLGVQLSLAGLLEGAGTAELADSLLPALAESEVSEAFDVPVLRAGGAETGDQLLSYGQKALWFIDRLAPEGGAYNVVVAARARGLDPAVLHRALAALTLRHPALRSAFPPVGDEPVRRVADRTEVDLAVEDAAGWSEAGLRERLAEEAYRPFDLGRGPLLRVRAFDRGDGEHALLLAVHHIAVDFASLAVVARDLGALIREAAGGPPAELPALPFGESDFIRWQEEMLAGPRGERLWSWWRDALAGLPDLDLPTDRARPPVQTYRGGARTLELPVDLADGARALAADRGATLFMVLLAAFQAQLARTSGQEDLAVGSPSAGRAAELAGVVGYFVNPVALRADLAGTPAFATLLDRTRRAVLGGLEHGDFPFALLAERLRPARDPARTPLFQVLFLLQRTRSGDEPGLAAFALGEAGGRIGLGGVELESLRLEERRAQFDLTLRVAEEASGRLRASLEFNADLFDAATAERMLGHFRTLLAGALEHPEQAVARLPLLTPAEREQALAASGQAVEAAGYRDDVLLHGLFEEQAARTPEAEALVAGEEHLTYAELNHRATELAHQLRRLGVGPEVRVGVRLGRSADLVVSLLGVLKAGGAYVPLDPKYPQERLDLMLEDSGAHVVIDPLFLRRTAETDASGLPPLPAGAPGPGNLAYLIYTSGSTGRPKAVAIEHRSASFLAQWARRVFQPEELSGVLAATSIAFDLSVFEIFVPLAWGGRVILAENALELPRLAARSAVTLVNTVPSAMAELVRSGGIPASVRTVNLAGEPIPPALAEAIHALPALLPERVRLYNLYGPSEDTTYSTWTLIAPGSDVTIGRPIDGTWAFVLDPHLEPLPVGVPGELYLGGSGLARGYLGRPELTAERFVPDPFGGLRGGPGARLYRTGDLVRRRPDGDLDFLGRIDHQVKIRGFRVELGEVEEALARHPAVRDVAVLALPEPGGGRRLAAYLVAREGETVEPSALRAFLQERLPEAFIPTGWRVLDALPLSPNGKVDRKELARLAPQAQGAGGASSSRPQGPVERELAVLLADALGIAEVADIGRHDDFFALGGHSLLATRVVSRASRLFGVALPVSVLFQAPTVASLAARIAAETGEGAVPLVPITPVLRPHDGREDLPLSFAQQRLWFLDRLQPGGTAYNMPGAAELTGALDILALAGALSEVVRRHETLRTRFVAHGGTPVQVVDPAFPFHPVLIDLSALGADAREELAGELTRAEAARPFDLARGPLLRITLVRLAPELHRLLLTLHHTVADGWSLGVLMDELAALYGAFTAGRPSPLDELPVQYADFVVWQRGWLTGEVLDRQLAWWQEQLAGAPATLDLPADRPRPTMRTITRTQRGGMVRSWLPPVLADGVRDLARRRGSTPFLVLLSAFQTFLGRLSGQEDLLVGSVVAGRTRSEIEGLIGFFANTLVLRGDLAGDPTFDEALERTRVRTLGAWAHQDLPVERLVEELQPGRELGLSPLFQVLFVLQGAPASLELPGLAVRRVPVTSGGARLDLTLELTEEEGGFAAAWELSRDLFEDATIERFAGWFTSLLTGALADPEQRLSALPLTSGAELEEILVRREASRRAQESATAERRRVLDERAALQGHVLLGDGPRTPVEELLAAIWAEVLGVERVGIHDDFFALGGHSLLATRMVSRIVDTLGVDLPLSVLFERPTVARLAERLTAEAEAGGEAPVPPLVRVPRDAPLPLSFAQQRLWFLDRLAPGGAAYNLAVAAALEGELDADALERSLGEIVRRHEALRTVFSETRSAETGGRPVQIVRPWEPPAIARLDLSGLPAEERRAAALAEAEREAARPFDLQEGPMVRFLLLALGPREHLLAATFHHIAADGWSLQVFQRELAELYGAFAAGHPARLPEPPVQYADFAVWQRRALSGAALHRSLTFWRRRLAGVEPIELPADGSRTPTATAPARSHLLDLPDALAAGIAELARAEGATPFMVLLAGVYALLARLTGERDLTVGAPVAARNRVEVEGLIGFFANTLPLRVDLEGAPSFRELLARVRSIVLEAHAYGDVPFERLVEELQPERVRGRNPLFDVMLAYLSAPSDHANLPGLRLHPVDLPGVEAKLDLAFTVHERGGSLSGTVEGRGDLFTETTLERLTAWYRTLLEAALADPEIRLSDLPLLAGAERAGLLAAGLTEGEAFAPVLLHRLFEERARLAPEAPALEMDGEVLTYAELDARADRLARQLRGLGVGPETRAAVSLERSPELVTAFLAIWKAGGAVVPIDPAYPRERIEFLLADSGAVVLVSDDALPEALEHGGVSEPDPRNLAYVLYTSGSTGRPKGVAVEHGSAAAHLHEVIRAYGLGPGERSLFFASPSFDVALEQILAGLLAGATVVLRGRDLWEPADLTRRIGELGLTFVNLPTAYWSRWVRESADLAEAPASLRMVLVGGEEMPAESARLWRRSVFGAVGAVRLINGYGPTETVITATLQEVGEVAPGPVSIGRPLPGRSAHVLDRDGNLLPAGARGELALGGVLARGYLGAPDRTAERFVPDPFSDHPGARLYRTGDLVLRRGDGELEFLGRIDGQIKVRGFRVEIGEVEAALRAHPGVREAVVAAVPEAGGSSRLAAWVAPVPGETPDPSGLRAFLAERLPAFMIPASWTLLAELPLTPHGKIDRRALPRPSLSISVEGWVAPRNAVEEALAGVWAEVLGVERVGAYDDFFHLGGHSLLATQLAARVRALFGVELPLSELFEAPTLAGMAERIEAARSTGEEVLPPVVRRPRLDGVAPLSFAQQRLWFLHQLDPESPAYNVPGALRLSGPLLPEALESALGEIVRRHEALRTVFGETEGEPVQRILSPAPFVLPFIDLAGSLDPLAEADRLGLAEARHRFDLATGPLLRALLLRVAEDEHLLVVVMHHVISDGWSLGVMTGELAALYAAFAAGMPSPLPELPVQYADFAEWQRRTLSGQRLERQLSWWRELLADPPVLDLPADHRRPPIPSGRGGQLPVALPADLGRDLRTLARDQGTTLYMVLLAAFATLLGRHAGQDDLTVGSPIAGRDLQEIEPLIGCFVNTLTLRVRLAGDPSFRELLARVREVTLGAYDHQGVPFERLVEELAPGRDRARTPLFQVLLVLQNAPRPPLRLGDLLLERRELPTGTAKFDLSLALGDEGEGIVGALEHSADLFEAPSMLRLLGHLTELLRGAAADPGRRLSDLPLLTAGEREQLLVAWNDTEVDFPRGGLLSDLVAAQAGRTPDAEAVVGWRQEGEERLTYRELLARADRLASHLVALGVRPEARVGICLERTTDLPVAVLAVLRAGGAYVPLDPAYPQQRLELMLRDSGANVLITQRGLHGRCGPFAGASVWIDEPLPDGLIPEIRTAAAPENLAYLIYTSGSTGVPKAVAIEHRSAVVLVRWALREFSAEELAGVLFATSICFDLSVFELFVPLAAGGKVLIAANALELPALPAAAEVTLVNTVPSALAELARAELARRGGFPASVRTVNLAGEPLSGALADAVHALPGVRRLLNLYGPSEDTTYSTWAEVPASPERTGEPRIGRPVAGTRVYLLDRDGNPVPEGAPGELFLAGAGLARGYLARPALTAERFVPDSFSAVSGGRLYRTGDLARWRAAGMLGSRGELEYLGRVDHQVKVRGFRVEPGEIEAALAHHPAVGEAVVLARDEGERGAILAAFLVRRPGEAGKETEAELRPAELRRFLLRGLPEHMVPTAFVELPALPLTPNGKVDRRTLARLWLDSIPGTGEPRPGSVAPRTPTEELLAALWGEVLGRERVGVEDSFFDLGGHSLLAMRLLSRVRATFGHDLPVARLFESPTIAELARVLDAVRGGQSRTVSIRPVPRGENQSDVPLSFAQERLWFLDRLQPGSAYNLPLAVRLHGPLDPARLGVAFGAIVARHEALRTLFPDRDGEPAQHILPPAPASAWPLPLIDLSGLPRPVAETLAEALGEEDGARPFSLLEGPLLRTLLLRLGDWEQTREQTREHRLLANMHHIVSDGWSLGVLLGELAAFYGGTPEKLPELPVQYADFAVWQKGWLRGRELERQMGYWRRQLEGSTSVLELPTDRPRPLIATLHGTSLPVTVPADLSARLGALARQQGVTPFMLLLAAWATLLHRWTGQADLNVGTPIAGRNRSEIEHLVGFFVNTLVLRTDLTEDPDFPELLARIRGMALAAYEHQDLPFEKLVDELRPERDMSRQPLFQVMFVLQNTPLGALELPGGLILDPVAETSTVAKFDLTFSLTESKGELTGSIEYNTDLFDRMTVTRLAGHFGELLTGIATDPGRALSALPILGEAERHQLLLEWADCRREPSHCLHEVIERQADLNPGLSAVECGDVAWTYRELDRRANRLAWHLRELGVGPEVRVALCVERGADMIAGMLGVLKAGGAYVPLDPAHPQERLVFMLKDCGAQVLLTQEALLARMPETGAPVVCLDRDWPQIARRPHHRPVSGVTVRNPAYVIYTSGSTGIPKGVMLPHESVVAYTRVSSLVYATGPGHRILQISSISFDASVEEIFCTLTRGATLVVRAESHEGAAEFLERCRRERITMLQMTTAYWHQVAAAMEVEGLELPPDLRVLFVGGEKMLARRLVAWWKLAPPDLRFVNAYGPTETTVAIALCPFPGRVQIDENLHEVPLGRPVPYAQAYVLDRWLRPAPIGTVGQLCLGGISLARGYLDRPALTAERFIPNPFAGLGAEAGERLYNTGDLVRLRPDSLLEFVGRTDHQVKIRGYRIELGEIETTLASHPGVGEVVVMTREDAPGEVRLAAFIAERGGKGETALAPAELRSFLEERLPAYMIPPTIQVLPSMPVNAQGKVDRGALARLTSRVQRERTTFAAPRNELEAAIAAVWREVFALDGTDDAEAVGIHDNFFDAGGSSLSLVKLHSRLQKALERSFPLVELFKHPTIAALAASLGTEAPAKPTVDQARARTDTRRESMRQLQQLREQRRSRRPGR
jgi:amino acid adenylation domain-containing protein